MIRDYGNLWRWMCDMYAVDGARDASPLAHMKQGYFGRTGNNTIPVGPLFLEFLCDRDAYRSEVPPKVDGPKAPIKIEEAFK